MDSGHTQVLGFGVSHTVAVFLPNWIGDVVMATPTLRNLRQHYGPNTKMLGIARPYVQQVLTGSSWLDKMVWYHPKSKDRKLNSTSVVQQLRDNQVDEVVMLTNSFRSAWIAWRANARERIGYARYFRKSLLTLPLDPPKHQGKFEPISAVDYYLQLLNSMGVKIHSRQPELYTTAQGENAADRVWENFGWETYNSVIGLNTGGAYGAAKHWPNQHSSQLALRLVERGHRVLIMCGPKAVSYTHLTLPTKA